MEAIISFVKYLYSDKVLLNWIANLKDAIRNTNVNESLHFEKITFNCVIIFSNVNHDNIPCTTICYSGSFSCSDSIFNFCFNSTLCTPTRIFQFNFFLKIHNLTSLNRSKNDSAYTKFKCFSNYRHQYNSILIYFYLK